MDSKAASGQPERSSAFRDLARFISNEMRMSHVYQPVMLMELLENGGAATVRQIAGALLSKDQSQLEYYEQVTRRMPGRVLTKNRGITDRVGKGFVLKGFPDLSSDEVEALVSLCQEKLDDYIAARGQSIWDHRRNSSGKISGSDRYEVLVRAKHRCELCGVSAKVKALQVDHIVPRSVGGSDDISNLQALCVSCNATKRNLDDTDFRGITESYGHRQSGCVFCEIPGSRVIEKNELAFVVRDAYPVTSLHTLIVPKRHVESYFELYQPELNAIRQLLGRQRAAIRAADDAVSSFNVGVNEGAEAGQTVDHCHVHLIPRRANDVEDAAGGIRGVIPAKRKYQSDPVEDSGIAAVPASSTARV